MEQLCYETLEKAGYTGYLLKNAPERVLQFGEGNFLRAFADYWFDMANEKAGWNGKCVLVQPIAQGLTQLINRQEGLYTLYLRGRQNGDHHRGCWTRTGIRSLKRQGNGQGRETHRSEDR